MKEELVRLMRFNKILYLKNPDRFLAYIIWFFLFLFGWLLPFIGEGDTKLIGGLAYFGMLLQYKGMSCMYDEERHIRIMPLRRFYGVRGGRLWLSRILSIMPYFLGLMAMLFIQTLIEVMVVDWVLFLEAEVMVILAFLLSALFSLLLCR